MAPLADALAGHMPVERTDSVAELIEFVPDCLKDGDVLLIKGSNSIGLSRLVETLAASEVA
jgi:UDP-N-acetylmuramoyl-tripeptide--D-alanyl-D-alanine ligase